MSTDVVDIDLVDKPRNANAPVGLTVDPEAPMPGSTKEEIEQLEADFRAENGYMWDWCMVFRLVTPRAIAPSTITILKALIHANLTVATEFDEEGTLLFVKIAASKHRLEHHADCIDMPILADKSVLQKIANEGMAVQGELKIPIEPFQIGDDPKLTKYKPYEHIFLPFETDEPRRNWFVNWPETQHPFNQVQRIKLIKSIITSDFVPGDKCAALNLRMLMKRGAIDAFFPLQDKAIAGDLVNTWCFRLCTLLTPWCMPVEKLKNYLGEKITLYFAFVSHFATWLLLPALFGLAPFAIVAKGGFNESVYSHPLIGIYGMVMAIWAIVMLEFWKRKQKRYNLEWGMVGFEAAELERPEYKGDMKLSLTSDKPSKQYPLFYYRMKIGASLGIIFMMVGVVVAAAAAIFVFRYFIMQTPAAAFAATLASILNSIQIIVLNNIYSEVALWLSKWENHKTDTIYQDSLITKLFAFQFVNSYASMTYIGFIQMNYDYFPCQGDNCMGMLGNNLTVIVITRMISSNVSGVIVPFIKDWYMRRKEMLAEGHEMSDLEVQFKNVHYDPIIDLIGDYANIAINYGYSILFVVSNPIVTLLVYISSCVEIRGDGFKLLRVMRRPEPGGVEDIGTWQAVFTFITYASVVSNSALICFTAACIDPAKFSPVWTFYLLQVLGFGVAVLCAEIIPDVPLDVEIQMERLEFWKEKVVEQVQEEEDHDDAEGRDNTPVEHKLPSGWKTGVESPKSAKAAKYIAKMEARDKAEIA